jgi:hypothetical protein
VDHAIAVVAIIPMVWSGYYRYKHIGLKLPVLYYLVATFVLVLTMVFRRPPKRVTSNPGSGCWRLLIPISPKPSCHSWTADDCWSRLFCPTSSHSRLCSEDQHRVPMLSELRAERVRFST